MAKQNAKSAASEIQNLFDPQGYQDVFKTLARMNERMASITVEAGTRATDIASETTKQALANVRELTQVRDEVSGYGKAYMDFVQKQTELFTHAARTYATETQKVGTEVGELTSEAGEEVTARVTANAESAAQTARSVASNAA